MKQEIKENLKDVNVWLRLLFALFFGFIVFYLVKLLVALILIVQFFSVLFTAKSIERLRVFSGQLSRYSCQILEYVGYNQDDKPFPFSDWPTQSQADSRPTAKKSSKKKSRQSGAKKANVQSTGPSTNTPTEPHSDIESESAPGDKE